MAPVSHAKSASSSSCASGRTTSSRGKTQQEWTHTHHLPTAEQKSKNGRKKSRNLISWSRPRMAEKLVHTLVYECARQKIKLPWDQVAHRLNPGSSGSSIVQWLGRNRTELIAEGHLVPPALSPHAPRTVRGVMRADLDGEDTTTTHEVLFTEPLCHRDQNLSDGPVTNDPFTSQLEETIGAPEALVCSAQPPSTPTRLPRRRPARHSVAFSDASAFSLPKSQASSSSSLHSIPLSDSPSVDEGELSPVVGTQPASDNQSASSDAYYLPDPSGDGLLPDLPSACLDIADAFGGNLPDSPSAYLDLTSSSAADEPASAPQVEWTSPVTAANGGFERVADDTDTDSGLCSFTGSSESSEHEEEDQQQTGGAPAPVVQNCRIMAAFGLTLPRFDAAALAAVLPPPPPFDDDGAAAAAAARANWSPGPDYVPDPLFEAAAIAAADEINQTDLFAGLDIPHDILGSGSGATGGHSAGGQGYGLDLTYQFPAGGSVAAVPAAAAAAPTAAAAPASAAPWTGNPDDVFVGAGGQGQPAFSQNLKRMRGEGEENEAAPVAKRGRPGWYVPQ